MQLNSVNKGDCLELMKGIGDKGVDMILCDLPYGTTACKWDVIIPFEPLWEQYERIIKDNGAIVLSANEPFATVLRQSNFKKFRYDWIWNKKFAGSFGIANYQPMRTHENICIFYKKAPVYNPQMVDRDTPIKSGGNTVKSESGQVNKRSKDFKKIYDKKFPTTILEYSVRGERGLHPTQKPVALFEYLIKTYTNAGETVLDNCAGSGTTAIACINTDRNYILIEKEEKYCNIIQDRIKNHNPQLKLIA